MKKFLSVLRKILAVIWWLIVVIVTIVFLWTWWVKTAANGVLDQIHQWQLEAVYNNSALADGMSYQDFATNMWVGTPMSIENAELKWRNGRWFDNDEKYIYGTFVFENWTEQTLTFWFQKVDGEYVFLWITGGVPEGVDEF